MNASLHLWLIPLLPFEVTSVLILIAILGAVALARHDDTDPQGNSERMGK